MPRLLPLICLFLAVAPAPAVAQLLPESERQLAPGPAPTPERDAPETTAAIAEIRVEGNRRVEADAIRNALKTKVGDPFDARVAREDLRNLWRLGFFADAQISVDDSDPRRPILVVRVAEKPAIREVKIRGNSELSDEDLKDTVEIKAFNILDMAAVRRNARKVQDKYVEKGYFLAEVTPNVVPFDNNEVGVYFDVNEHAKVQIKRITFVGNRRVPDKDLKEVMQTEEGGFLAFLSGGGTFREEVFQRDLAAIQGVYYDRGFIHVRVGDPQVSLSADKRFIFVTVPITEGEQYRIGAIDFSGDLLQPKEQLGKKMTVLSGELFNRTKLQRDIMALTEIYLDEGYAYANISPQTAVDSGKRIVDLTFDIQKGNKVRVERIEIRGNERTRDKVIRRELRVFEGELFSGTGLRQSRQRVTALGFFETVDLTHRRGSTDDSVIVEVTVKEKPTGTFQVGLGFSSVENFLFTAQVAQNNLFGWGQTGSLAAQVSSLRQLYQLSYLDPYFLDTPWIFSFDAFRQELDYFGFIRRSTGGDITWGYHLTEDLMLHLGYAIEDIQVEPGGRNEILLTRRFRNGLTSALRLTLNLDKRDNRLFPTSGHYQSFSVEKSPQWLGASFIFTRYLANTRWYKPLFAGVVAKAQGSLGFIDGEDIPISELFFLGGITTVRGFGLRSIAPEIMIGSDRAPDAPLREFLVGGNKQAYFNFELEFPIVEKAGIKGVVFYDVGNVFAESQSFFESQEGLALGLLHSAGFGFRWFSPIGPLRFEWGIPITRRAGDEGILFEFTIGNSF